MVFIKNIIVLLKSIYIVIIEYIKYKCWINTYEQTFSNITNRLSNLNLLYTKILQWVINDTIYKNNTIKKIMESYTDNVQYDEIDIDYESLLKLTNDKDIKLVSYKPIKSGTISLIYKGILNNETPIVIKMLKKNIHEKLVNAVNFFIFLGNVCKYIPYVEKYNLSKSIIDNKDKLLLQVDFIKEVNNIETFYTSFKENSKYIIPKPYKNYTEENNNIIVMEYIEGVSIYSVKEEDKIIYIKMLYEFIFECIFNYKIFHGDLHPGNILFQKEDNIHKIGIIDYGITEDFNDDEQKKICIFFKKLSSHMYEELFNYVVDNIVESPNKILSINDIQKKEIVNLLLHIHDKHDVLKNKLKASDIYYINRELEKYNLILSIKFSKIFLFLGSMYSLLYILQNKLDCDIFNDTFIEYCNRNMYIYFILCD
jgi:predicted unusual protein kinase regulating ubiquinone biosynthesis (AarF/ABC1/UbiB family)